MFTLNCNCPFYLIHDCLDKCKRQLELAVKASSKIQVHYLFLPVYLKQMYRSKIRLHYAF